MGKLRIPSIYELASDLFPDDVQLQYLMLKYWEMPKDKHPTFYEYAKEMGYKEKYND